MFYIIILYIEMVIDLGYWFRVFYMKLILNRFLFIFFNFEMDCGFWEWLLGS